MIGARRKAKVVVVADFRELYDLSNPRGTEQAAIAITQSIIGYVKAVIILTRPDQRQECLSIFTNCNVTVISAIGHSPAQWPRSEGVLGRLSISLVAASCKRFLRMLCSLYVLDWLRLRTATVALNPSHLYTPKLKLPTVTTAHAILSSYSQADVDSFHRNLELSAAVVVAWPTPHNYFKDNLPIIITKLFRIPFFTEAMQFKRKGQKFQQIADLPSKYYFYPSVFLGRKNHRLVIEGLKILRDANIIRNVVFTGGGAGDSVLEDELKSLTRQYGLEKQILFLGSVSASEVGYLYDNCYACLFPSLSEAGVSTIQEGLVYGKTTLCADTPEARSNADMYKLELSYFEPKHIESFTKALHHLEVNFGFYEKSAGEARRIAMSIDEDYVGQCYAQVFAFASESSTRPHWYPYLEPQKIADQ